MEMRSRRDFLDLSIVRPRHSSHHTFLINTYGHDSESRILLHSILFHLTLVYFQSFPFKSGRNDFFLAFMSFTGSIPGDHMYGSRSK